MNKIKRTRIFSILREQNPSPTTELVYQATDVAVNRATKKLYAVANTPEKIHTLGLSKLKSYIKTIGLYNNKANNIIETCRLLVEKFNSEVPKDREPLESLPGVGRKTANVVLNTYFSCVKSYRYCIRKKCNSS